MPIPQLYLIAHKVRGQPAFDIAIQMMMEDGPWWIIPTSGHRAYPYAWRKLHDWEVDAAMPASLPDHYPTPSRSERPQARADRTSGQLPTPRLEDI